MRATVVTFAYAGVHGETVECLMSEARSFPDIAFHFCSNDALIDRARSRYASMFLETEDAGDVLMMIDRDIIWRPGDLNHIISQCAQVKSVVCGIYPKRGFGGGTATRWNGSFEGQQGDHALVKINFGGTGFMAIHRDVLKALSAKLPYTVGNFWPFFLPTVMSTGPGKYEEMSEDYALCLRALAEGFTVYADLFPVLCHIGEVVFRMEDSKDDPRLPNKLTVYEFPNTRHPVLASLADDAAKFLDIAQDSILHTSSLGGKELARLWNMKGAGVTDNEWYQDDDVGRAYILNLMRWQLGEDGETLFAALPDDTKGKRVLDFGSGIGTAALMLAEHNTVYCVEPNDTMWLFTEYRAGKLERRLKRTAPPLADEFYDVILCWHVLEHLEDPGEALHGLVDALKPGGLLIHQSDFHADSDHPMHHEDFDTDGVLRELGLVQGDPFLWRKREGAILGQIVPEGRHADVVAVQE